ncbi:NAD(P)/FAD-dependent oxidoreductase [Brevibacterium casei]|uniref:NAD(P)/FAD-dependent oxidoreductase n=1 Tax=Brevibacterium casei TaxID=33889 RepID=UPI00223ADED9|nr:FAD-dependent oxidoreductase [Brevibacterium casei]MCT1549640.1 FAD-binding oxidoreductase [Brevibacterium casei]MCT1559177.1 FAD-binding oxidoreductase [Brevibacterium casei]MCT2207605.1 FAD-binding oxidoreductase [Brevibacterium casei]
MLSTADVVVVGGGLIGAATALHLAKTGVSAVVIDRKFASRASNAAAGMITPACEYDEWMPRDFWSLLQEGLQYYPDFLAHHGLEHAQVGYRKTDFTLLGMRETDVCLSDRFSLLTQLGAECQLWDIDQVSAHETHVSPGAHLGGIRIHQQAVVDPRKLLYEMTECATAAGVAFVQEAVESIEVKKNSVVVTSETHQVQARDLVLAAGPWNSEVARLAGVTLPPLTPVKGQMVELHGPPHLIDSVIFMPGGGCGSIVERSPGRYIVGTSEEYLAPNTGTTVGVITAILARLGRVMPGAQDWEIADMWCGFRPMHADELPSIGRLPGLPVIVAGGHHRNGVLLAPLTGKIVTDIVAHKEVRDLSAYRPDRNQRRHSRFAGKY